MPLRSYNSVSQWVQVVEVTDDGGERGPKVACSIKLVDQREGTDLDPHNVKWQPRGEGGPGGHGRGPAQPAAVVQQGAQWVPSK